MFHSKDGAAHVFFDLNTCHLCIYRFEKENSSMKSWLDRCESVCCPDTKLLSADKVKLRNELQNVQVNHSTISYVSTFQGFFSLIGFVCYSLTFCAM